MLQIYELEFLGAFFSLQFDTVCVIVRGMCLRSCVLLLVIFNLYVGGARVRGFGATKLDRFSWIFSRYYLIKL